MLMAEHRGEERLRFIGIRNRGILNREVECILKNTHHGASQEANCSDCELLQVCSKFLEQAL